MRIKKTKLLHKGETAAIGKCFTGKSRKYFSAHQYNIKYLQWSKIDLFKETKKRF